jgi:hypothetical protein
VVEQALRANVDELDAGELGVRDALAAVKATRELLRVLFAYSRS